MKNPMTLAVIGAAVISILLGIAGANHEPKSDASAALETEQQETATQETTPVEETAPSATDASATTVAP